MNEIFQNVQRYASSKGMSIMALEIKAGLGNGTIGRWRRATPMASSLAAVAHVLGVTVNDLLETRDEE